MRSSVAIFKLAYYPVVRQFNRSRKAQLLFGVT